MLILLPNFLNYRVFSNECLLSTLSPVEPEKNKVSLIVERDHLSAQKLWVLWEKRCKQSSHAVTQTCGEVV